MKAPADNLPIDPDEGMESTCRLGPRRTIRRIEVTMEREVIEIFHRSRPPQTCDAPCGPEQHGGESANAETCQLCGQTLPAGGPILKLPALVLPADAQTSHTLPNEMPKE